MKLWEKKNKKSLQNKKMCLIMSVVLGVLFWLFFHNESGQAVKQAPRKAVSFLSLEEGSSKLGWLLYVICPRWTHYEQEFALGDLQSSLLYENILWFFDFHTSFNGKYLIPPWKICVNRSIVSFWNGIYIYFSTSFSQRYYTYPLINISFTTYNKTLPQAVVIFQTI